MPRHINTLGSSEQPSLCQNTVQNAVLSSLLQVLSADEARQVSQHVGIALHPGGTIHIIGSILNDSRTSPPETVGNNLNFISIYYTGEACTERQPREWFRTAGFEAVNRATLPGGAGLITARKGE